MVPEYATYLVVLLLDRALNNDECIRIVIRKIFIATGYQIELKTTIYILSTPDAKKLIHAVHCRSSKDT